jgi:flagellar protein FliT
MKTIDHYLSIAAASQSMVSAARAGNWDDLVSAQQECAVRIDAFKRHQEHAESGVDPAERKWRARILGEILAHDAEIRNLTDPWLRRLEQLLSRAGRDRRLGQAYGSGIA